MNKQKIQLSLVRTYLNSMAHFSELKAGLLTANIVFTPRKGKLTDENRQDLSSATWEKVTLRDMQIQTYRWEGEKGAILLAHGWESNSARWMPLINKLRKNGFAVVALDAPAHAETSGKYFNAILYAEAIAFIVQKFKPVAIVGHSVGAFSSAYYAARSLDPSVKELVLLATPSELSQLFDKFLAFLKVSSKVKRGFYKKLELTFNKPINQILIEEMIKNLDIKGLVIHDKKDDVCPFGDGERIHANWKNSSFVATDGYGHSLREDEVHQIVAEYLTKELTKNGVFVP